MPVRVLKDENGKKYIAYPSEFKPSNNSEEAIAQELLGYMGRMVGGSKSIYRYDNPRNFVVFNANICVKIAGKIWHGDIDVTKDIGVLKELAKRVGQTVYVLYEMAARFENEKTPDYSDFAIMVSPDETIGTKLSEYIYLKDGIPYVKTDEEIEANKPARAPETLDSKDYKEVELPDLKTIKVLKKSDPLSQFQKYFVDKYGKEKAVEVYRSLYVTASYYKELEKLATKYAKKTQPGLHPVKLEQSVAWYLLEMSPLSFSDPQTWEKPNTGYVKKEK
jgi:hypothetical protein